MNAKAKSIATELGVVATAVVTLYGLHELVMRSMPPGAARTWTFVTAVAAVLILLVWMNDLVNRGRAGWMSTVRSQILEGFERSRADGRLAKIVGEFRVPPSGKAGHQAMILSVVGAAASRVGDVSLAAACERAKSN